MNELEELIKSMNGEESDKEALSIKDISTIVKKYFDILWAKKWIIVIIGLIGGIIGLVYAWNKKVTYTAHYTFTVGGSSSATSSLGGLSSLLNLGGGGMDAFTGDNVLELLKSPTLMEKTLLSPVLYDGDSITFMEYALICDSTRAICEKGGKSENSKPGKVVSICDVSFPLGQDRATFTRAQDSILAQKANGFINRGVVVARRDKKLSFMEYSFDHQDEVFAKAFSEAHLKAVSDFYIDTKTALARRNVESFQSKADSVRKSLDQCFSRRAAYSDANRNANGQYVNVTQWKIDTDIQILSTTYTEMIKNIELLKLNLAKETPLIQIIDEPRLPLPNDKMGRSKGAIIGGFLAGFLACLAILGWNIFLDIKKKMEEEETSNTNNEAV